MTKLIDNVFDYDSYRYIPNELKAEWKNGNKERSYVCFGINFS